MSQINFGKIQAQPQSTQDAQLVVTPDAAGGQLPAGAYTFSVVVTDDANQNSAPATVQVFVRPVPQAKLTGADGNTQPVVVGVSQNIQLLTTVVKGGPIKNYAWSVKNAG